MPKPRPPEYELVAGPAFFENESARPMPVVIPMAIAGHRSCGRLLVAARHGSCLREGLCGVIAPPSRFHASRVCVITHLCT